MTNEQKKAYLDGEFNAVAACGQAVTEAMDACKFQIKDAKLRQFIAIELTGVLMRDSQLIKQKNDSLGIETPMVNM